MASSHPSIALETLITNDVPMTGPIQVNTPRTSTPGDVDPSLRDLRILVRIRCSVNIPTWMSVQVGRLSAKAKLTVEPH